MPEFDNDTNESALARLETELCFAERHTDELAERCEGIAPAFAEVVRLIAALLEHADDVLAAELTRGSAAARSATRELFSGAMSAMEAITGAGHAPSPLPSRPRERSVWPPELEAAFAAAAPGRLQSVELAGWDEPIGLLIERLEPSATERYADATRMAGRLVGATAADLTRLLNENEGDGMPGAPVIGELLRLVRCVELLGGDPVRVGSVPLAVTVQACVRVASDPGHRPDDVWLLPADAWRHAVAGRSTETLLADDADRRFDDLRIVGAAFGAHAATVVFDDGRTLRVSSEQKLRVEWSPDTTSTFMAPHPAAALLSSGLAGRRLLYAVALPADGRQGSGFDLSIADQGVSLYAEELCIEVVSCPQSPPQDIPF